MGFIHYRYKSVLATLMCSLSIAVQGELSASNDVKISHEPINTQHLAFTLAANEYSKEMTQAIEFLRKENWDSALIVINKALKSNPNSQAAKELQQYVATRPFTEFIRTEQWDEAVKLASNLDTSQAGLVDELERARKLVKFENELDKYIQHPISFTKRSLSFEVDRLLREGRDLYLGNRIQKKYQEFSDIRETWLTPIEMVINSDGLTTVSIVPGGNLGSFETKVIRLNPGDYELSGQRNGFYEVRKPMSVRPGQSVLEVVVIADKTY